MSPPLKALTYTVQSDPEGRLSFSGAARALGIPFGTFTARVHRAGHADENFQVTYTKTQTSQYLNGWASVHAITDGKQLRMWYEPPGTIHFEQPDPFDDYARWYCGLGSESPTVAADQIAAECARLRLPNITLRPNAFAHAEGAASGNPSRDRGPLQNYFRLLMFRTFNAQCAFCGFTVAAALEAAHVLPWVACNDPERIDAANGLLLCATHHRLFDAEILSIDTNRVIVVADRYRIEIICAPLRKHVVIQPEYAPTFAEYLVRRTLAKSKCQDV
jgi:hypothetical protein